PSVEEFRGAWEACAKEWAYFPSRGAFGRVSAATRADRVEAFKHRFESLRSAADALGGKARKLEARLNVQLGGYSKV
ncbi:unnamed protein product, partial [Discosporangium mesarthrocarpum]